MEDSVDMMNNQIRLYATVYKLLYTLNGSGLMF